MKTRHECQSIKQIGRNARRSGLFQGTLCCAVLLLLWAPVSTSGQTLQQAEETFNCGDCAECTVGIEMVPVPITNLTTPKPPDLVLCADDAAPASCMAHWVNNNPQTISGVQDAIVAINARFLALGRKVNVLINGHGSAGEQCFGSNVAFAADAADCGTHPTCNGACPNNSESCLEKDTTGNGVPDDCKCGIEECIGNATTALESRKGDFVNGIGAKPGAKDKIKDLILMGCSLAAVPNPSDPSDPINGQAFLLKLAGELNADSVKGFSGINSLTVDVLYSVGDDCGADPVCGGACPAGEVCMGGFTARCRCVESCGPAPVCNGACAVAGETCWGFDNDSNGTDDGCACGTAVDKSGGYKTEGDKKTVKVYTDLVWVWGGPNGVNYTISPGVWTLDGIEKDRTFPDGGKVDAPPNTKKTAKESAIGKFNDFHYGIDIYAPNGKTPKHMEGSGVWSLTTLVDLGDQIELKSYVTTGVDEDTVSVDYDFTSNEADPTIVVDINAVQVYAGPESGFDAAGNGVNHVASRFLTIEVNCGNNVRDGIEQCDGTDDAKCPGSCQPDCSCAAGSKIPAVSEWGLSVMLLILLTAGTVVLGRRRYTVA